MSCPHCHDTGWRTVTGDEASRVERCECWRTGVGQTMLAAAKIPPRYRSCELETFVTYPNEKLLKTVERARRFIDAFPVVDKGLLLIGPPGIGKTHIAVAVLRQVVLDTGVRGLYYDTRHLLTTIRSTYNPVTRTSEVDILRPVMEAELLVLDDLGAERPTDWVEETMNPHRQHPLQRPPADHLHLELRGRGGPGGPGFVAGARRVSHAFPSA